MSSRQRRAQRRSNPSSRVDTPKDGVSRVFFRQDEVLKPTAAGLDEDSYPVYLLEAATLYTVDGEDIASLLEVGVKGSVEVRGRLTILPDEAEVSHLRSSQRNGQWLAFRCDAFSIGWGPSAIWALGDRKWFEIQPSSEYKATYAKMTEGVAVYYYLTELHEQLAKHLNKCHVDDLFLLYAEFEGNSLTADVIRERVKTHAPFLLTQMSKTGGHVDWKNTGVWKWLVAECPEIHQAVIQKTIQISVAEKNQRRGQMGETALVVPVYAPPESTPKDPGGSRTTAAGELTRRQITTLGEPSAPTVILRTIQELLKEHHAPDKITMATVWAALYYDLSIDLSQAKVIFRCHAQQVLHSLDKRVWGNSQLYKDLTSEVTSFNPSTQTYKNFNSLIQTWPKMSEKQRKAHPLGSRAKDFVEYGATAKTIKLKARKPAGDRRQPVKKISAPSLSAHGAASDKESVSLSPEPENEAHPPRSGKAVPGMPRGKNAILRPSNMPTPQYSTDTGSGRSFNPDHGLPVAGSRGKKRKVMEPEMGDLSDDETMWDAMDDLLQQEIMDDATDEEDLEIKLVDVPLQSTDPTGPNGSWVCARQDCSTIIHDSTSDEGKLAIRNHLYSHADPEVMQYLVEAEAQKHAGVKTQYLLEKIRKIGATKRMEEEAAQAGKLKVVKPIKRTGV